MGSYNGFQEIEAFTKLCLQIKEIDRRNASDYPQVTLIGRDCYLWKGYVVKSSPIKWNFKTRHELEILKYVNSQDHSNYFPKLLADATVDNRVFLLLEYIPSLPLSKLFYQHRWQAYKLTPGTIRAIEKQGRSILEQLSQLGIVHRDITPENVLFDIWKRHLVLIDFGFGTLNGKEVQTHSKEEKELLEHAVTYNLGGKYRKPNAEFSYETDNYSFEKIIQELRQRSPWNIFSNFIGASKQKIFIDDRSYDVVFQRKVVESIDAPRLILISHQPNEISQQLVRVCISAIQQHTPEKHELWVVDNNSPWKNIQWLFHHPNINIILNRTEPLSKEIRGVEASLMGKSNQRYNGSYANAVGLEIATRFIDPQSNYMMTLHMDTMPCYNGWLSFLKSKLGNGVGAAGVRMDKERTSDGVLHVLGNLIDFQLFRQLNLDFFPQLPQYDVGDRITIELRTAGNKVFSCRNSLWEPQLIEKIPSHSPLRHLQVDRSFDDNGNVIFLHLGRGIGKSSGHFTTGTTVKEWIRFAEEHLSLSMSDDLMLVDDPVTKPNFDDYSIRRHYVDEFYLRNVPTLPPNSLVLDLGGNKIRKRGLFDINNYNLRVIYANLSSAKRHDVQVDAAHIPFKDSCYDAVICSELLEHVRDPTSVLQEAYRVLRDNGIILICVPFLFRIHRDPDDYGRYTSQYWQENLAKIGFADIKIERQGLFWSVLMEMLRGYVLEMQKERKVKFKVLRWFLLPAVKLGMKMAIKFDKKERFSRHPFFNSYTTGYGITAIKPDNH